MNKLREKFDWYLSGGENCPESDQCEQITDDFSIKFAEWIATNYLKLNVVWVGIYQDQRNKDNWKSTTELQQYFKENVYVK